jgi:RNA polymerase sigma factor (sigma-70 family)
MATDADTIPTQPSLLIRLKDLDDQGSWQQFFETYWRLIFNLARKAGFNESEAEDIVQETFVRVARHIPEFQYDPNLGSFKSWLLQITRTRIYDALRRKHAKIDTTFVPREVRLETGLSESRQNDHALEAIWDIEWKDHLLKVALDKLKAASDVRQFQIFHLHVIKGVKARLVARRLGARLHEVYVAKYKLSRRLKKELKKAEDEPGNYGIPGSDLWT